MGNQRYRSRVCPTCKRTEGSGVEFYAHPQHPYCKQCSKERYNKQNNGWNKPIVSAKRKGCLVCGYNKCDRALEFHHLHSKVGSPLAMAQRPKKYTMNDILDELDKCVVLCSNCHREQQAGYIVFSWDGMDTEPEIEEEPAWMQLTFHNVPN